LTHFPGDKRHPCKKEGKKEEGMTIVGPLLSAVEGNRQKLDGGAMFGNVPRPMWTKWLNPDERGRIELACRAMLIEWEGKKILCETGVGAFFDPKLAERFGVEDPSHHLLENLAHLGVSSDSVDYVILSHLHFDHAGGLLPTWKEIQDHGQYLLFPNATYIVGAQAFARAKKPHFRDKASFIPGMTGLLEDSGRLRLVEGARLPGVFEDRLEFRFTDGHTPGQMHTVFRGDQRKLVFAGDLIPGTSWVHLPITMGYDRFPEKLIDEKRDLYETIVSEDWWCFYTHDLRVAMSRIRDEDGKFIPFDPQEHVVRKAF